MFLFLLSFIQVTSKTEIQYVLVLKKYIYHYF